MIGNIHRRMLTIAGPIWWQAGLTLLVSLAMSAALLAQAFLVGVILVRLYQGRPFADVSALLVAVAVLVVGRAVLAWLREVCVQLTAAAVKDGVRTRMMDRLVELGPGYLIRERTGQVQSTTVDGVEALENYFGRYLPQLLNCVLTSGVVVGVSVHSRRVGGRGDAGRGGVHPDGAPAGGQADRPPW